LARLPVIEEDEPERWLFYCPDCAKREFEVTMADLDGLDHERRGLAREPSRGMYWPTSSRMADKR
jgi:hypothetical protein